jgi:hypothetical protein
MTFILTLDAVKAAAREAFLKGDLGFQKGETSGQYVGSITGAPCAVGAALPDELRQKIGRTRANNLTVVGLADRGYIESAETFAIYDVQSAHDAIIRGRKARLPEPEIALRILKFKELVGVE